GAVTVFRDISELKEIENKLRAINEELENFAYLASHDLKAPLRVIHNASQWLKEDLAEHLRDEDRENLDLLQNRANRMERLLDDLLQYSRIGRVTDDRFREKISGTEMMENIVNLLATPEDVVLNISENFANIANARMPLQQILYNLIGNSIKHREGRSLRIDVDVKTVGDSYIFTVADNGPGIPAKYHQRIFDIFRTLKPRDQVEGSGIGLSVVKKYVTLYGGRIEVHSAVGEGCCFTITWPISPQQANR
ncbi:ATP-binding protein, partial [Litorivivens sp.]